MNNENEKLTKEEAMAMLALTHHRIETAQKKAQRRLSMTNEDKELFASIKRKLNNDKLYRQLFSAYLDGGSVASNDFEIDISVEENKTIEKLQNEPGFLQEYLSKLNFDKDNEE